MFDLLFMLYWKEERMHSKADQEKKFYNLY